jgi:hypothetical protein
MNTPLNTTQLRAKLLERLGLEQRRSALGIVIPGIGLLGAGAVLGIGLCLLIGNARDGAASTHCSASA